MELVSVIIPYFKKRKYINSTLMSVFKQSYKKIEVILIFDEKKNKDLEYLKNFKKKDKRLRIICNNKNLGAGFSRNIGIKAARGQFICFIDADDLWKKDKIKKQLLFMKKNDYFITHTDYEIVDKNNEVIGYRSARNFFSLSSLLKSCDIGLSTVMIKKKILSKNTLFADFKTKEDFVLWLKILKKDIKIYGFRSNLTKWRKTEDSLSSSVLQKLKDGFKVYYQFMNFNIIKSLYYLSILSLNFMIKSFLK